MSAFIPHSNDPPNLTSSSLSPAPPTDSTSQNGGSSTPFAPSDLYYPNPQATLSSSANPTLMPPPHTLPSSIPRPSFHVGDGAASTISLSSSSLSPAPQSNSSGYSYSPATANLLARMQVQRARDYDEARSHVLSSIVTSDQLPPLPPSVNGGRGPGRPRGSLNRAGTKSAESPVELSPTHHSAGVSNGNVRGAKRGGVAGRGRGRGRPPKRKKRKMESDVEILTSDEDENVHDPAYAGQVAAGAQQQGLSDSSDEGGVNLPLKTKSGRSIHRPSQFVPSPTQAQMPAGRRKSAVLTKPLGRPSTKSSLENAVCKGCERGHSPGGNAIVFCDGCGVAWHQFCHDPPISSDVVDIVEREWACGECERATGRAFKVVLEEFGGSYERGMDGERGVDQKRAALNSLSKDRLVEMLLGISNIYPNIAMFPTASAADDGKHANNGHGHVNENHDNDMHDGEVPYDGYETDPPAHYPKSGQGLSRSLPTETEDMPWLLDDNFEVFQQIDYDGNAGGGASNGGTGVVQSG